MGTGGQWGATEAHLRAVLGVLEEGIVSVGPDRGVVAANASALRILGLTQADLEQPSWWRRLRPRDADGAPLPMPLPAGEDVRVRVTRATDGRTRDLVVRRVELADGGSVYAVRDRTEARRTRRRLEAIHVRDMLTGLPNRTAALAAVEEALASRAAFALFLVDVDGFRAINVGLGQTAGDAVLRELAGRLRAVAPRSAHVARFGGDEFLVVARADGDDAAASTARRLQDAFVGPFTAGDGAQLTASIGVARSDAGSDAAGLVSAAEAALAVARSHGRGLYAMFDDALRRR
ncbi:MAG TPA: sensor domain-containing diguanylate cyclase, partial [Capillimicrobium sp.]|nr:sensor domain-containing diguanylate cyclase [Capillimicrobium sp.]